MEAVVFIGIQGSGKSTFFKQRFFDTHIRISFDMLKTKNRENLLFEMCLKIKQSFVIDKTNSTSEDRKKYIIPAKESGFKIVGYYFQSKVKEAIIRNNLREGKAKIPVAAILSTHSRLEIPSYSEGFDELYYVSINERDEFVVEEWKEER